MEMFRAPPGRAVFVYPPGTRVASQDAAKHTILIPPEVGNPAALWRYIRSYNRLVETVYIGEGVWALAPLDSDFGPGALNPRFTLSVREKAPESLPSSPVSSTLQMLLPQAREKAESLIEAYRGENRLTVDLLSRPSEWRSLLLLHDEGSLDHMGRECTKSLIEFLQGLEQDSGTTLNIVTGTIESGKTYSSQAAALYLFLEFHSSGDGRFMYMDWLSFLREPGLTMLRAFALAYHNCSHIVEPYVDRLKNPEDTKRVLKYLRKVTEKDKKKLYIFLEGCHGRPSEQHLSLITLLRSFAIVVLSGSPQLWELKKKEEGIKKAKAMLVNGGFSDVELQHYLGHRKFEGDLEKFRSGWVPGLVDLCIKHGGTLDDSDYVAELKEFIRLLPQEECFACAQVLAGSCDIPGRFLGEGTGLFYKDEDEKVVCVTQRLAKYANVLLVEKLWRQDKEQIEASLRLWTSPVVEDDRLGARIGLNAEAACLLVCRLQQPVIHYQTGRVEIAPKSVRTFRESFTTALTRERRVATLYIPELGTETGLDSYFVDDGHIVCLQFATGKQAVEDHKLTRPRAESLFQDDDRGRTYVLAWIVYTVGSWAKEVKPTSSGVPGYHEAFLKFGDFDSSLSCIDEKLAFERKHRYGGEASPKCSKCGVQKITPSRWQQCEHCFFWYHFGCRHEESCAGCIEEKNKREEAKRLQQERMRLREEEDELEREQMEEAKQKLAEERAQRLEQRTRNRGGAEKKQKSKRNLDEGESSKKRRSG